MSIKIGNTISYFLDRHTQPPQTSGMSNVNLSQVTLPTPQPYDRNDSNRQQENFFYVINQILALGKQANWQVPDLQDFLPTTNSVDITELTQAVQDLQFNGQTIDLGAIKLMFDGKTISIAT
jgi:hypothetical protein